VFSGKENEIILIEIDSELFHNICFRYCLAILTFKNYLNTHVERKAKIILLINMNYSSLTN